MDNSNMRVYEATKCGERYTTSHIYIFIIQLRHSIVQEEP